MKIESRNLTRQLRMASVLFGLLGSTICAQTNLSVDWFKISNGGGTSAGGSYQVSGTIGQHDAGGPIVGSNYSVSGGFWSIYAVQAPGVPPLHISQTGPSTVLVWWLPSSGNYTLQTNSDLKVGTWIGYGGTINSSGATNSVTISPPMGNLFFRLTNP